MTHNTKKKGRLNSGCTIESETLFDLPDKQVKVKWPFSSIKNGPQVLGPYNFYDRSRGLFSSRTFNGKLQYIWDLSSHDSHASGFISIFSNAFISFLVMYKPQREVPFRLDGGGGTEKKRKSFKEIGRGGTSFESGRVFCCRTPCPALWCFLQILLLGKQVRRILRISFNLDVHWFLSRFI